MTVGTKNQDIVSSILITGVGTVNNYFKIKFKGVGIESTGYYPNNKPCPAKL